MPGVGRTKFLGGSRQESYWMWRWEAPGNKEMKRSGPVQGGYVGLDRGGTRSTTVGGEGGHPSRQAQKEDSIFLKNAGIVAGKRCSGAAT